MLKSLAIASLRSLKLSSTSKVVFTRTFATTPLRTVRDILDEKRSYRTGEDLKAYLRLQLDLLTVQRGDSAATALDKMIKNQTPVLLVMEPDRTVAGIMTDRDFLRLIQNRRSGAITKDDDTLKVEEMMTPKNKLVTVTYTDSADYCQEQMVNYQCRFLPVILNGKLHGILSFSDFLAKPSRFEPEARRAIFAEEGKNIVTDDYSFSLTDMEGDKLKEELSKRVEAIKNRKL